MLDMATIVAKNYLPQARVLARSFARYHPRGRAYLLLADRVDNYFDPAQEPFTLIEVDELREDIPSFERFLFQYSVLELTTALKPYFLQFLFSKYGCEKLVYLDSDILITSPFDELETLLDQHCAILTPHITSPFNDDKMPSEVTILQSGTNNMGFLALRKDDSTKRLLDWWKERLVRSCLMDPERGLNADQKWMDLAPSYFEGIYLLRKPGYNVAYWNLHERQITNEAERFRCNGGPLYFFHFSGFSPDRPNEISWHQDRHTLSSIGAARDLFSSYARLLREAGLDECRGWPYAFGQFDNGVTIPDLARRAYLELGDGVAVFGNPFETGSRDSYYRWLTSSSGRDLAPLLKEVLKHRPDLVRAFPNVDSTDRRGFLLWVLGNGKEAFGLDELLLLEVRKSLQADEGGPGDQEVTRALAAMGVRRQVVRLYERLRQNQALRPLLEKVKPIAKRGLDAPGRNSAHVGNEMPRREGSSSDDRRPFG